MHKIKINGHWILFYKLNPYTFEEHKKVSEQNQELTTKQNSELLERFINTQAKK